VVLDHDSAANAPGPFVLARQHSLGNDRFQTFRQPHPHHVLFLHREKGRSGVLMVCVASVVWQGKAQVAGLRGLCRDIHRLGIADLAAMITIRVLRSAERSETVKIGRVPARSRVARWSRLKSVMQEFDGRSSMVHVAWKKSVDELIYRGAESKSFRSCR